jgi:hypothetical protein
MTERWGRLVADVPLNDLTLTPRDSSALMVIKTIRFVGMTPPLFSFSNLETKKPITSTPLSDRFFQFRFFSTLFFQNFIFTLNRWLSPSLVRINSAEAIVPLIHFPICSIWSIWHVKRIQLHLKGFNSCFEIIYIFSQANILFFG